MKPLRRGPNGAEPGADHGATLSSLNNNDSLTNKQLIHGSGSIYALNVINQGTIKADGSQTNLLVIF
jgi:hypothetical protein